jgi:hypothetical protein
LTGKQRLLASKEPGPHAAAHPTDGSLRSLEFVRHDSLADSEDHHPPVNGCFQRRRVEVTFSLFAILHVSISVKRKLCDHEFIIHCCTLTGSTLRRISEKIRRTEPRLYIPAKEGARSGLGGFLKASGRCRFTS